MTLSVIDLLAIAKFLVVSVIVDGVDRATSVMERSRVKKRRSSGVTLHYTYIIV